MSSSLEFIAEQMVIYIGLLFFIAGVIGGPLVLIVFLSLRTFRQSSCAFYLICMSIINIPQLFTGLLTYIMINGFDINWINMSLFYCKFRPFYVQLFNLTSMTCLCLATIDQFFATCSNPRWHQWNNIKIARYLVISTTILWILYGIPFPIFLNHIRSSVTNTFICAYTNSIYQKYITSFHQPVLMSCLPVVIMIIFGTLAYRNVRQIPYRTVPLVRRELDKQLTSMVLVEVCFDVIAVVPQIIQSVFYLIVGTPIDSSGLIQYNFVRNLANILYYLHFVYPFYIYVCVSKRFRQQLIHVLLTIHLKRFRRIAPET